ncbi:MAG: propanediol utilization protein, partial [Acidobacteria bacterium]|nr:propanediol utilization protein [Acidobacteriota bacterium]
MKRRLHQALFLASRKVLLSVLLVAVLAAVFVINRVRAAGETVGEPATPAANLFTQDNRPSPDNIWQFINESAIVQRGPRQIIPQVYRTVQVNEEVLRQRLATAPQEFTRAAKSAPVTLSLPLPDGTFGNFHITESSIMEPALAAQFPEIKTYIGQGLDDPAATARLDVTPAGFHAMILSEWGTVFVDPYAKGDTANYITYFKADYRNETKPFQCYFSDANRTSQPLAAPQPNVISGTILRTYRLALAATGEYTAFQGGTVSLALAAMTTTMNRVNGVYEKDLAVRMILVSNEAAIIYTNAATDPYTNNDGFTMLSQNQTNLDVVIGSANYDIGHVFSTGGGGVAGLGVVCNSTRKAQGVTGSSAPTGDGFDIDYVAHEMGHQFGGNHTFNGITANCGSGNRAGNAAYEPGSGSTIMAYAGICGAQDLQAHSDDYFHVKSLEEMASFIAGTACDVETNTGNTVPTVTVGAAVTIPKSTPFTLTATGSDPNGDALTYCWEEYDLGVSSPPDTDADGNARPILRSFTPTSNPSRTFPKLTNILNNTSSFGEVLPSISRTMSFQVTVRDNRAGGGGINTATKSVVVSAGAGPFLVTAPNTAVTWNVGTQQTVTWDVANTAAFPVSAANVKLSLSTDGGNTFPITLLASTPNDGSEVITVPNNPTTTARLKIEAVGNVFFDLSNQNFTIASGGGCTYTIAPTTQTFSAAAGSGSVTVTTQSGCTWTALSNDAWLTVTAGASGTGNGTVSFNVAANASTSQRSGTMTIAGQIFTVTQAGSCSYAVSPTSQSFTSTGGTGSSNVTTTAGCNWTAASNDSWITITSGAS